MTPLTIRPYRPTDKPACLGLFDSNMPQYFGPAERPEFADFLDETIAQGWPYLVIEAGAAILACGGLAPEDDGKNLALTWGMVAASRHGQGLGRRLLQARLALARTTPAAQAVALETSQHSAAFYTQFGFVVQNRVPNGFAPGLDRISMVLPLPLGPGRESLQPVDPTPI